jgi:hypothetical protein
MDVRGETLKGVTAATAVALALLYAGSAVAAGPVDVVRQVMTAAPGKMPQSVRCVSRHELLRGDGRRLASGVVGVTIRTGRTRVVLLDWKEVCLPLHRFRTGRRVQPADAIKAMATVLHEKAHVNGVRTEWKATCVAIPSVLRQFRLWGYNARQVAAIKWYLTEDLDNGRAQEYKLRGRCHVGAPTRPPLP